MSGLSEHYGPGDRDYSLRVADFGPIARADVEFRPLTVFVGPSNTGKSYLATLGYALHRYFAAERSRTWYQLEWIIGASSQITEDLPLAGIRTELEEWVALTQGGQRPGLPGSVVDVIRGAIEQATGMADPLRKEIVRTFGIDRIEELIRRSSAGVSEVAVAMPGSEDGASLRYRMRVSRDRFDFKGDVAGSINPFPDTASFPITDRWAYLLQRGTWLRPPSPGPEGTVDERSRSLHLHRVLRVLVETARRPIVAPLSRSAYYLPADRTGIMHSHKMVVGALVQSAATAGLRRTPDVPMLSGVLTDFLEQLIRMGDRDGFTRERRISRQITADLEEAVLGGAVRVELSDTNYPQFLYRPQGWTSDLALMRSSSMVSELAPLVLYLRHVVDRGDVLVIEEPESHLHPAMQVAVIEWVARIVRAGVRVILTTHSEWILDGLANMVQASRVAVGGDEDETDGAAPVLHPWEVGAWRFRSGAAQNGVVVEEAEIDEDGMYRSGFDKVAVALHNRWANIQSRTRDSH